jgi:hypothetical protein
MLPDVSGKIVHVPFFGNNNKSNENFKATIPSKNYDRPKTTGECGTF